MNLSTEKASLSQNVMWLSKNAFDNRDVWLGILEIACLMPTRDNTAISMSE